MKTPALDTEKVMKTLLILIMLASLGTSFYFTMETQLAYATLYMVGTVLISQLIIINELIETRRLSLASNNLLEEKIENLEPIDNWDEKE